jgi:hypothetical protein
VQTFGKNISLIFQRSAEMQLASLKSAMAKKELRVTKMVMAMILAFILVWSPYAISAIVVIFASHNSTRSIEDNAAANILKGPFAPLPVVFAKISTFVNPILYVVLNPQVKTSGELQIFFAYRLLQIGLRPLAWQLRSAAMSNYFFRYCTGLF